MLLVPSETLPEGVERASYSSVSMEQGELCQQIQAFLKAWIVDIDSINLSLSSTFNYGLDRKVTLLSARKAAPKGPKLAALNLGAWSAAEGAVRGAR